MLSFKLPIKKYEYFTEASFEQLSDAIEGKIHRYSPINRPTPLKGLFTRDKVKIAARAYTEKRAGSDFLHPVFHDKVIENVDGCVIPITVVPSLLPIINFLSLTFAGLFLFFGGFHQGESPWLLLGALMPVLYFSGISSQFWKMLPDSEYELEYAFRPIQLTRRS